MFRVLLLPKSVLPNYPSESPGELQAVYLPIISLLLLNLFSLLYRSSSRPILKEASHAACSDAKE